MGAEPDDIPGSFVVVVGGNGCVDMGCDEGCVGGCGCPAAGGNNDSRQSIELTVDELDDDDDDEEEDARHRAPASGVFSASGSSREGVLGTVDGLGGGGGRRGIQGSPDPTPGSSGGGSSS